MSLALKPDTGLLRRFQEDLMEDGCLIRRGGVLQTWPRTGATVIPCRAGEERTFAEPHDPYDANTRAQAEWAITTPWDMPGAIGDEVTVTFAETGEVLTGVAGENNRPETWLLACRLYITRQKSAVAPVALTFKRDADNDGSYETTLGPYQTRVIFERVSPIEIPVRYSVSAQSSWRPVRLVIDQIGVPIQIDDIFLYADYYGVVVAVIPGQQLNTEALAVIDFGGAR